MDNSIVKAIYPQMFINHYIHPWFINRNSQGYDVCILSSVPGIQEETENLRYNPCPQSIVGLLGAAGPTS